jgi:hypothetical protein
MKLTLLLALLAASLVTAPAQQAIPREEALKVALVLARDLKQLLDTPIPTDPDVKRPVAVRGGERGCLVLPETKLAEGFGRLGKELVPVGQLWLRQLVPAAKGERVKAEKLKVVTLQVGERSENAVLCTLALRQTGDATELLVLGKDKEPLVQVPVQTIRATQADPIEISATVEGDSAQVTLKLAGKYQAVLQLAGE